MKVFCFASLAFCLLTVASAATPKVVVKGAKMFVESTGEQFYVKGMSYQPSLDPLSGYQGIQRDLPYFKQLGINVIRVYQASGGTPNHDAVMKLLENAGIYVILDVPEPQHSINRNEPEWRVPLFNYHRNKIDAWIAYPNLLAFIAGNEVSNNVDTSDASAFVKASLRDLKAYIKSLNYDTPVGYATADVPEISEISEYFDCGSKEEQNDFWGVNIYRWCGDNQNFITSGFINITQTYSTWDVPTILTEYGCNTNNPRTFPEVLSIYGNDMKDVFSGGIVYEYHEEVNQYGLIILSGNTVTPKADFENFKNQLAKVSNPVGTTVDAYTPSNTIKPCPPVTNTWRSSHLLPPTPSFTRCNCKFNQLECRLKVIDPTQVTPSLARNISDAVGYVCSTNPSLCALTAADATTGTYGVFSMCDPLTTSSIILDTYYQANKNAQGSCDFNGLTNLATPTEPITTDCTTVTLDLKDHGGEVRLPVEDPGTQTISTVERETGEYSTGQATTTGQTQSTTTATLTTSQSTISQSTTGQPNPQTSISTTENAAGPTDDNDNSAFSVGASLLVAASALLVLLA